MGKHNKCYFLQNGNRINNLYHSLIIEYWNLPYSDIKDKSTLSYLPVTNFTNPSFYYLKDKNGWYLDKMILMIFDIFVYLDFIS